MTPKNGFEPAARLFAAGLFTRIARVSGALEGDSVLVCEVLTAPPEQLGVALVGRAVGGRIEFVVAAALARLEPHHARPPGGIRIVRDGEQGFGDGLVVVALVRPGHAPAVGLEPFLGRTVHHFAVREAVDAVVVPIEEVDQVVEPEPVGRVLDLVVRPGRVSALTFHREDSRGRTPRA